MLRRTERAGLDRPPSQIPLDVSYFVRRRIQSPEFMSLANARPFATTTPQTCGACERTPRCDGLTGFCPAGGTKKATSFGRVGSLTSITRTPSEYQDVYRVFPTRKL